MAPFHPPRVIASAGRQGRHDALGHRPFDTAFAAVLPADAGRAYTRAYLAAARQVRYGSRRAA